MLTSQDLKKLKSILHEEISSEIDTLTTSLQGEIKLSRVKLEEKINKVNSKLSDLERISTKTQKDQKIIANYFDREYLQLRKDVDLIKSRIGLP